MPPAGPVKGTLKAELISRRNRPPPAGGGIKKAGDKGGTADKVERGKGETRGLKNLQSVGGLSSLCQGPGDMGCEGEKAIQKDSKEKEGLNPSDAR